VGNDTPHTLARISLRWMIRECFKTKSGIMFDCEKLFDIGLDPTHLYPNVLPRPPPLPVGDNKIRRIPKRTPSVSAEEAEEFDVNGMEEQEELKDALSPLYDQLALAKGWWVLEVLPMKRRYQKVDDTWAHTYKCARISFYHFNSD
jgi:hypothetical protein